jgi:hypothetical protein
MINISIKRFLINEFIILVPLALCITNFIGYGKYWFYLLVMAAFFLIFQKKIFLFDFNLFWLTSFTILYSSFRAYYNPLFNGYDAIQYILVPVSFYVIGKYFSNKYPFIKITYFIIYSLAILFCLVPFLSNIISVIQKGFMSTRDIKVIWYAAKAESPTIVGAYFALHMSFVALLFISTKDKFELKLKYLSFIMFLIGLFVYANLMTRTGIFISLVSLIMIFILTESRRKIKYVGFVLLLVIPIIFLLDFYGFFKWFEQTAYFFRFSGEIKKEKQLPRIPNWLLAFNGLFQYPFGGAKTKLTSTHAHNLWLDVGWTVGVVPLIPLLIFTYRYIITIWRINKNKYFSVFFRSVIICVSIGFLLSFSVEPIMEGLFVNFCLFCLFFGIFDSIKRDFYCFINEILKD